MDCDAPVTYGVFDDFGDPSEDAIFKSECSCRSGYVCVVSVWPACVWSRRVFIHEQILQLYPD
jgi:hypothetical protein